MPPSRPRAGYNRGQSRPSHRGGVQKRGHQTQRVDKDGDISMEATGTGRGRGRGRGDQRHTPTAQTNGHGNPFGNPRKHKVDLSAAQKSVFRLVSEANHPKGPRAFSRQVNKAGGIGGLDQILVRGLKQSKAASNADGGLEALVTWLERKATAPNGPAVKVRKSRHQGDDVIVSVRPQDTAGITRLSNFQFAGANITIELYHHREAFNNDVTVSPEAERVKTLLRDFLTSRYNEEKKLLDLSGVGEDPELVRSGIFDSKSRISKLFPALMGVCDESFESEQQKTEAVTSISLAKNNLFNIDPVFKLAQTFPNIKNLDLSDNHFKHVHALEKWRNKFALLEYLVISGNPFENDSSSMPELMSRYSKLRRVESHHQDRIREEIQQPAETGKLSPTQLKIASANFPDEGDIAKNFLTRFFPAYDNDRLSLLGYYYDTNSVFSLSVNTQAPREQPGATPPTSWGEYIKTSRNLRKIDQTKARMNRLHEGRDGIQTLWNSLPITHHPDLMTESDKWCIECHLLPGVPDLEQTPGGVAGMIITVHGEFTQLNDGQKKSFDRTFVLGPAQGPAVVRVLSDMVTLRSYGGIEAFRPNIPNEGPQASAPQMAQQFVLQPTAQPEPPHIPALPENFGEPTEGKTAEQLTNETKAMELTSRTHMTIAYSAQCLKENEWDLEKAHKAFEVVKKNLPLEVFLPF